MSFDLIKHQYVRASNPGNRAALNTRHEHTVTVETSLGGGEPAAVPASRAYAIRIARRLVCIDPRVYADGQIHTYREKDDPEREWHETYVDSVSARDNVVTIVIVEPGLD